MKTELQERADILASNLQRSVDACFEVLRSISQLFASSDCVEREDFRRFVEPALLRHPSIQALEWLPRLRDRDRSDFEQAIRSEGFPGFQVTERTMDGRVVAAERRSEYFPVHYVAPLASNRLAMGFDLASDATRRAALEKARDTGAIALSGRIELVQETQKQFGFLVILPIYFQGKACDTPAARRSNLQGFVLGVFQVGHIVRSSLTGLNLDNIDFYLHDKSNHPQKSFLAVYEAQSREVWADSSREKHPTQVIPRPGGQAFQDRTICTRNFEIADRQWSLLLLPTSAYVDRAELYQRSLIRADAATAEAEKLKRALLNLQQTQARWFLEKRLIAIGVGLILLVLCGANLVSYLSVTRLLESKDGIERTYTALASLAKILSLTSDPAIPSPVQNQERSLQAEIRLLRETFAQSPTQLDRLNTLESLVTQRLNPQSRSIVPIQQQIQQQVNAIEQEERSQLPYWKAQAEASVRDTFLINLSGIFLSFVLLVGIYYLLQRQITERQQVEVALFEANNQLEIEVQERTAELAQTKEISDLKLRLFSMVSHEFRTPLSTILISTQLLENSFENWSDEKKLKNLSRIQSAAKTMAQLLNDILTLGRAEAGKLEFRPEPIDLLPFCHRLIEELQISLETQQAIEFLHPPESLSAQLDPKLLHSILTNLLSNAVKYSPPNCSIQLILSTPFNGITFQIKDQGIGIPDEDLPRLYEAFHRGKNVGDIVGTGLGLAVVKTCVDLHSGQITVESQEAKGTTFTIYLPQQGH